MFAFMPFMHTENILYQKKGFGNFAKHKDLYKQYSNELETIRRLTDENHPSYSARMGCIPEKTNNDIEWEMLKSMEPHIVGHRQTIEKFGRFPKRNKALGRESTTSEIAYMEQPEVQKRPY